MNERARLKHTPMVEPTISDPDLDEEPETLVQEVPPELAGQRLDRVAAILFPAYSRSRIQGWIDEGALLVDGAIKTRRYPAVPGMKLHLVPLGENQGEWIAQEIPLQVVYEDEDILVIDKPAGLVVHPGAGNWDGTLLNGLLFYDPKLVQIPRAGIVHRLDKDTTGLMVVARNLSAQNHLIRQLQQRSVTRIYLAIVQGGPTASGTVEASIGRSPNNRLKMAVVANGREAITHYQIKQKFENHKLLELKLETGRTHQIRVHLAFKKWPILGDPVYGGKNQYPKACTGEMRKIIEQFPRQALHAARLELIHPRSGERLCWRSELPKDMQYLVDQLAAHA